ncbi:MAG: hypothetical protein FD163_835 [Hyphomonadaceae bacterium]|nr:MAG: hypothetical protein FD128_2370 [Hyphomonadaceae bacterium]KAF0186167.1 MAG: hypothetical protein FD163_835 [Hyphomonadaceae bacterium]
MGLYNELIVEDPDLGKFDIQFKFGELWLYKYKIGDCLRLADSQMGLKHGVYIASGIANISGTYYYFKITFRDAIIIKYEQISESEYDILVFSERNL